MVKYGSVSSASVQLTSAHCQAHHCQVRPVKMRSHSSSDLKGACQDHKLTWPHVAQVAQVKRSIQCQRSRALSEVIIIHRHCIISQNRISGII